MNVGGGTDYVVPRQAALVDEAIGEACGVQRLAIMRRAGQNPCYPLEQCRIPSGAHGNSQPIVGAPMWV